MLAALAVKPSGIFLWIGLAVILAFAIFVVRSFTGGPQR
jgi:hypothetical protein